MEYLSKDTVLRIINHQKIIPLFYREFLQEHIKLEARADVVEVKHGKWVSLTECANAGVYCSVCHKKVYKEDYAWCNRKNKLRSDYCPNCGAKMDGGKK